MDRFLHAIPLVSFRIGVDCAATAESIPPSPSRKPRIDRSHASGPGRRRERARLRQQALDWLRADLALHAKKLETGKPEDRAAVRDALREWQEDDDLACIREAAELARLPADDRAKLEKLWADVAALTRE